MTEPLTIPLSEALQRILSSTATNEGPDAQLSFVKADGTLATQTVAAFAESAMSDPNVGVFLLRTVKNWSIVTPSGEVIVKSHPWDDAPNVAFFGSRLGGEHVQSVVDYLGRLEALANEAERVRAFEHASLLWRLAVVTRKALGVAVASAESEFLRTTTLCQSVSGKVPGA